ncbi:NADH-quinone oxidoreductase subunit N [Candidatus Methanomassiliicoccus intestinalis]|uniref:NADH-quinone oxidoreductase subunit N n=1 Tax=Candidatus Methanomassiliicoccus intestinalis TaxID=1406512 RepID=UPI0037DD6DD1
MDLNFDLENSYAAFYPMLVIILFAVVLPAIHRLVKSSKGLAGISLIGLLISAALVVYTMLDVYPDPIVFNGTALMTFDVFAAVFSLIFLSVAALVCLLAARYIEKDKHLAEFFSLTLLATAGMMIVASSSDIIMMFVGLETTSIASYALVAFRKKDKLSTEAGVKYVIIGGFSTALSLYGISLLYGVSGTTNFELMNEFFALNGSSTLALLGIGLMIAGFGFKIALVPFHMWAPDVYEGAPTPTSTLLAAGSKSMGFVLLFKMLLVALIALKADWEVVVGILAILTMTVGNLLALAQTSMKRMLAYSSIAQAGYVIIAIAVATQFAVESGIFHIITHAFMKAGAFIVVGALIYKAGIGEKITDYKGLATRAPLIAFAMMIFMFALAGIPPLSGFWSKVYLFSGAVEASAIADQGWLIWLAIVGILNSALSLYYYARVVKFMYVDKAASREKIRVPTTMAVAIAICTIATVVIGLWPDTVVQYCEMAAGYFSNLPLGQPW